MLRKSIAKKNPDEYEIWEKTLMAAGDEDRNWTDRKYLRPILEAIR
ncbi:MAG TPA: hypothetical protein H9754_05515 [Candidatus Anaerostipes avistercoris]|uniref:Uncharacterized protein n=1 Tax=Candidatus Anaerostipes avistercoris TaxID=2838462 RepID=A0A9D2PG14_9FIRM|nr:hypothetical protein [Candidatus Anaerostipes avistercoris]